MLFSPANSTDAFFFWIETYGFVLGSHILPKPDLDHWTTATTTITIIFVMSRS